MAQILADALSAVLQAALPGDDRGAGAAPDDMLLSAWLALWALAETGGAAAPRALAEELVRRPLVDADLLAGGDGALPPAPAIAAAAALALHSSALAGEPSLAQARANAANAVTAAWRPNGRFAFVRQAVPVTPRPFLTALAVAAWVRLPDPVPDRRQSRAARVLTALSRLAAQSAGDAAGTAAAPAAAPGAALWGAAELLRHAGLAPAAPAVRAAAEARLRDPAPSEPEVLALQGLALASAADALRGIADLPRVGEGPGDRRRADHCARGAARLLAAVTPGDGPAAGQAVALALAATALLPDIARPAVPRPVAAAPANRPALRPAVRPGGARNGSSG